MKNIWLALLVLPILFSCKSKSVSQAVDSIPNKFDSVGEQTKLIEKFKPLIQGDWVISTYVDDISRTRSPYKSRAKLWGNVEIHINMVELTGDSILAGLSMNNHEGGQFAILFRPGKKANCLQTRLPDYDVKTNVYELGYIIKGADTNLMLYRIDKNKVVIDSVKYTKVVKKSIDSEDAGSGIDYITNKKLFSGTYLMLDSVGKKRFVEFSNEGEVYNFSDFEKYVALTDFVAGPANNLDQLIFNVYTKQQNDYAYKFVGDTLKLYDMTHNADSTLLFYGKLRYKLVKQK